jgi:putative radical SAM enzyme (TIGR03279 family)
VTDRAVIAHAVAPDSPAAEAGVPAGARLLSVNGHPVQDALALRFLETADRVDLVWEDAAGVARRARIFKPEDAPLGLDLEPLKMRACNNKCAFCFAHQNARGMRRALYFKDDDFRFSFLNGNFATLTNLSEADLARVIEQRLSPLYISVHATEWPLRNQILGNPKAPNILEQLEQLAAGGIRMHTQVVLCPELNDGAHLRTTLEDLARFHPFVQTIALVPVGLTRHRDKLPALRSPDPAYARSLLVWAEPWRRRFLSTIATRLVFPSDEFYLLAGRPFPAARTYEGYPQLGNGVGGSRKFLDEFRRLERGFRPAAPRRVTIVTGQLAVPVLERAVARLNAIEGVDVRLVPVRNTFFGGSVTCAGLLTGQDILGALSQEALGESVLIPSVTLKDDEDVFLDDMTLTALAGLIGRPALRVPASARGLVRAVLAPDDRNAQP